MTMTGLRRVRSCPKSVSMASDEADGCSDVDGLSDADSGLRGSLSCANADACCCCENGGESCSSCARVGPLPVPKLADRLIPPAFAENGVVARPKPPGMPPRPLLAIMAGGRGDVRGDLVRAVP